MNNAVVEYPKSGCVLDLTRELQEYRSVIQELIYDGQLIPLDPVSISQLVEESMSQIFRDCMTSEFMDFSQNIQHRPILQMFFADTSKDISPHGKILLEEAWKALAISCYMICRNKGLFRDQLEDYSLPGFSYVMRNVLYDGVFLQYLPPHAL